MGSVDAVVKGQIRALTGLRFVAAMWVVLYHFRTELFLLLPEWGRLDFLVRLGFLAVPLFFALSGFILAYQHYTEFAGAERDYPRFLAKRLARIYPLHVVTLLGLVVAFLGAGHLGVRVGNPESYDLGGAAQDVFLVRGWIVPSQGWNSPAWSLSAEWFAYLCFPVVVALVAMRPSSRWWPAALLLAMVAGRLGYAVALDTVSIHPLVDVMTMFVGGVALFRLVGGARPSRLADLVGGVALILLIGVTSLLPGPATVVLATAVLAFATVGGLCLARGPFQRLLSWSPIEWGGRISFSIYLIHNPLATVTGRLWRTPELETLPLGMRLIAVLAWPVLVIAFAAAAYHLIERPGQRLVMAGYERWASRRRPPSSSRPRLTTR